jgi:hypothetical protein
MNQRTDVLAVTIATIALVVAIVSAAMAWAAYDRTTDAFTDPVESEIIDPGTSATEEESENTQADDSSTNSTTVPQSQP